MRRSRRLAIAGLMALSISMATRALAEVDPEKFFAVEARCPTSTDPAILLIKANSAGQLVRIVMLNDRLSVSLREPETPGGFKLVFEVTENKVEEMSDESYRPAARNGFSQLRMLQEKVCNGTPQYRERYRDFLKANRATTRTSWPLPD